MKAPIKLLMIAHCFPPDTRVGAMRPARFCRYLPELGIQPVVLTVEEKFYPGVDRGFEFPHEFRIARTSMVTNPLNWWRPLKKVLSLESSSQNQSASESIRTEPAGLSWRDRVTSLFEFPDEDWGWYWPALKMADRIIKEEKIDAIFSTSPPVITHSIGLKLKERYGLPWILDFRDPWTENVLAGGRPDWYMRKSRDLERRCVTKADVIICNTDRIREAFTKQFPESDSERYLTITNGFEKNSGTQKPAGPSGHGIEVLHLGSLYSGRRLDGLAKAVAQLRKTSQLPSESVRFSFVGSVDPAMKALVEKEAPDLIHDGVLRFEDRVSFEEAQLRMWNANVLLLVQGSHTLQIPAKFYEYLPTGKPMLAISEKGALTDILNETEAGTWASPEDIPGIQNALLCALKMPTRLPSEVSAKYYKFDYRTLTDKLAECVRSVVGTQQPASLIVQRRGS
jgi:hypothetical protein